VASATQEEGQLPAFPDNGEDLLTLSHGNAEHLQGQAEERRREFSQKHVRVFDVIDQLFEELVIRVELRLLRPKPFGHLAENHGPSLFRGHDDPVLLQAVAIFVNRSNLKNPRGMELVARRPVGRFETLDRETKNLPPPNAEKARDRPGKTEIDLSPSHHFGKREREMMPGSAAPGLRSSAAP
jgi:hypothetical protein